MFQSVVRYQELITPDDISTLIEVIAILGAHQLGL